MVKIMIVGLLFVACAAHAQLRGNDLPPTLIHSEPAELDMLIAMHCRVAGDVAFQTAQERDAGWSYEDKWAEVNNRLDQQHASQDFRQMVMTSREFAYQHKELDAMALMQSVDTECLKHPDRFHVNP